MTRLVRKSIDYFKKGFKPLVSGLALGFFVAWIAVGVVLPILPAHAYVGGDATSQNRFCFTAVECHKSMAGKSECQSKDGCCVKDRCYMPGEGCQSKGDDAAGTMGLCYAKSPPIELKVKFGDTAMVMDIGDYLEKAYKYAVGIAAFLAAIMMIIGGFFYLTAGDNQSRVTQGKDYIKDALIGLAVVLSAWLMLNTINPDLIRMQLPKVPVLKKALFIGCTTTELCQPCGKQYTVYVDANGEPPPFGEDGCPYTETDEKQHTKGMYKGSMCPGKSCYLSSSGKEECRPGKTRCRLAGGDADKWAVPCGVDTEVTDYICAVCLGDGGPCTPSGNNDYCCGGFCSGDVCTGGQPGDPCGTEILPNFTGDPGDHCVSGICQTNGWNTCSSGEIGSPCDNHDECKGNYKCQDYGMWGITENFCTSGSEFSRCDSDDDCQNGYYCWESSDADLLNALLLVNPFAALIPPKTKVCMKGSKTSGYEPHACKNDNDCKHKGSAEICNSHDKICTDGSPGTFCKDEDDCAVPEACTYLGTNEQCKAMCASYMGACTEGKDGTPCDDGYDCRSGRCANTDKGGVCVSGHLGGRCGDKNVGNGKCEGGYKCIDKRCDYP